MAQRKMYIAAMGMLNPIGMNAEMTFAAAQAGVNRYSESGYFTDDMTPVKMALVPNDALPEINDDVMIFDKYSRWDRHLFQMASVALSDAMEEYEGNPIPIVMACPEQYEQWSYRLGDQFFTRLFEQTKLPIAIEQSRTIQRGRAGGIEAVDIVERLLFERGFDSVVFGGIDSYQRPELFRGLLQDERLLLETSMDGFVPGEGACFIRVTKNIQESLNNGQFAVTFSSPGFGEEPGHLYSDETYMGDGLAAAFSKALSTESDTQVSQIYSSMNGERFWSKEYGVATTRNNDNFIEEFNLQHPADCFGDLGAATGPTLIGLAALNLLNQKQVDANLVYASSDYSPRAALKVELENVQNS